MLKQAIDRYLSSMVSERRIAFWATATKAVLGRRQRRLGALVLQDEPIPLTDEEALPQLIKVFGLVGWVELGETAGESRLAGWITVVKSDGSGWPVQHLLGQGAVDIGPHCLLLRDPSPFTPAPIT